MLLRRVFTKTSDWKHKTECSYYKDYFYFKDQFIKLKKGTNEDSKKL